MKVQNGSILEQYQALRELNTDCILCFKIGVFYEMFYDDAIVISRLIGLAITYKTKQRVPMCGFHESSLEVYIHRIMLHGYKVAVSNEKLTNGKIAREIERIYTKGTMVEDNFLDSKKSNFILAYTETPGSAYAIADISTGEMYIASGNIELSSLIETWDPVECLLDECLLQGDNLSSLGKYQDRFSFYDFQGHQKNMVELQKIYTKDILATLNYEETRCIGFLIQYAKSAQRTDLLRHMKPPQRHNYSDKMLLHTFTMRNLELFQTFDGYTASSIYNVIHKTMTASGSRLLRKRLQTPSNQIDVIRDRLNSINWFVRTRVNLAEELTNFCRS